MAAAQLSSRPQPNNSSAKVLLKVDDKTITLKQKGHLLLEIPTSQVAATGYDDSSHSKGWAWLHMAGSGGAGGGDFSGLAMVPFLVGAAVAAPFKTTEHYVRVIWKGADGPDEIVLEVGKSDYADVIAQLQRVTGNPWQDLPKEREELRHEIDQAKSTKKSVNLDRVVFVNGAELKSGEYQLVLLERAANVGEVYFFRGADVKSDQIVAQAVVEIDTQNHSAGAVDPAYGAATGVATITSLAMPEETLRLTSAPLPEKIEHAARSFHGGSGNWLMVRRANYEGESAFRFKVFHLGGCVGYLYVTRQRIVFSLSPSSNSHCDTFAVARTDVQTRSRGANWLGRYLQVKWKDRTYNFRAVFEGKGKLRIAESEKRLDAARQFYEFFVRTVTDFDAVDRETPPVELPATQSNN